MQPMELANQTLQFVPALKDLHRTAYSPLRYAKAAKRWGYKMGAIGLILCLTFKVAKRVSRLDGGEK
ncbi:hypothetical protein AU14_14815 [Marinobacter similis]|uniref:Uncharacterized protein n=1 Tax=Marinobacter similis TaxID=1420916 RepID=W5YLU1_9GAMM|nr:hypothetical protein AU14_14815 [Marinobacter similis]